MNISEGQYESARSVLGDDYNTRLEQFVNVAGATDNTTDDQTAQTLNETRTEQRAFANATESYQNTSEEYERARENGNTTAARQAARELENISTRVETLNRSVQENYEQLENQTGIDTTTTRSALSNATEAVLTQQASVRNQTFVETTILVSTNDSAVAFDDPITISGQLSTANGTTITNRTIRLLIHDRSYRVQTNGTGYFSVAYRPVTLPVNATDVTISYVPQGTSPYLGSSTNASVSVTQVTPSVTATTTPTAAGYGESLTTTATVTVDGRPVPMLPITATVGSATQRNQTGANGQTILRQAVPATVGSGEQSVSFSHDQSDIAVGPVTSTTQVTITQTPTNLSVSATTAGDQISVMGQLRTESGLDVPDQPVTVDIGGVERTSRTNETGWYQVTLPENETSTNSSVQNVTARFDGTGTNLDSSQAATTVTLSATSSAGAGSRPLPWLIGAGVLTLVALGAAGYWVSRRADGDVMTQAEATTAERDEGDMAANETAATELLETAHSELAAGDTETATVAAYGAVRKRLGSHTELHDALTHREFVATASSVVEDAEATALATLSDAYERATYRGTIDSETAEAAVTAAVSLTPKSDDS